MIETLATPKTIDTPYGPVNATHRAWGFTNQAMWNGNVQSYSVLGFMDGTTFKVIAGTEEYLTIEGDDLTSLLAPNTSGKKENIFRVDDVVAKHKDLKPPK